MNKGDFTLPGEAGYEELTLRMAEKWGADVIRDSDGTKLSEEIVHAGYGIYSTICMIRDHNEWAARHKDQLQQTFLMSEPVVARNNSLRIRLLDGFFEEQFEVNDSTKGLKYWEVYDRTEEKKLDRDQWSYNKDTGEVIVRDIAAYHSYTVNFLAYRIWEEISMYNHITNGWTKEHLMPIDPRSREAQEYLYHWLKEWCEANPDTTVVRFTSMFYNFVWIWGSDERKRNIYTDWGSYDFTVSPDALDAFEREYGYSLCSEDFINQGKLHVTHMSPGKKQRDYMAFINRFVVDYGRRLVGLVHEYGKLAYVFYDDSWIGVEPYSSLFPELGFDGIIKCVFSGYEVRMCAGVKTPTHEIRLHPYLFPVGLGGAPTFSEGGNPTLDAKRYWLNVRRALLRQPVERIGLGGYLHLVEDFPDFCDYIEKISDEFRNIKEIHKAGKPYVLPIKTAVLHSWGSLRPWTLSGHFHETYMHELIHINEALSGLPVEVSFIDYEDIKKGALKDVDIVINAGRAGTAWSGGDNWKDADIVCNLLEWVDCGGTFIGVGEPSAIEGYSEYFRMKAVLGVDKDNGARVCHGKWDYDINAGLARELFPDGVEISAMDGIFLTDKNTKVLLDENGSPKVSLHEFGRGKGVYLSGYKINNANTRFLLNLLLYAKGLSLEQKYLADNVDAECAYYPKSGKIIVINNSDKETDTRIRTEEGEQEYHLNPFETLVAEA